MDRFGYSGASNGLTPGLYESMAVRVGQAKSSDASETKAALYCRVSTSEQVDSGAGLDAQESALLAFAASKGWTGEIVTDAGVSTAKLDRPALTETLARLDRGDLQALVVTRLDRLTRSVADFAGLADRASAKGWAICCMDVGVDTSTASGELVANIIASTAQYERRLLSARTKEGLAAKKAAGVRLGRPPVYSTEVMQRVLNLRGEGCSMRLIAELMTASGVPTAKGGPWTVSTVQSVLGSERASTFRFQDREVVE